MTNPEPTSPAGTRYTAGQTVMVLFGVLLLLPGLCSLVVMLDVRWSDPMLGLFIIIWVICFLVSAGGAALIYAAHKRSRRTQ